MDEENELVDVNPDSEITDDRLSDEPEEAPEEKAEPEAEDNPEDKSEDEDGDGDPPEKPKKQRPGRREREKREISRLKAELDAVKELVVAAGERAQPTEPQTPPKQEDFESFEDFVSAKARYDVRTEFAERERQAKEREATERQRKAQRSLQEQRDAMFDRGTEKYADFEEVFHDSVPVSDAMARVIVEMDAAHEVAYYLGQHEDEAARIARMNPLSAAREMGRIEAKVTAKPSRKVTAAPAPAPTVSGGDRATKDPSKMSISEYRKWREGGGG